MQVSVSREQTSYFDGMVKDDDLFTHLITYLEARVGKFFEGTESYIQRTTIDSIEHFKDSYNEITLAKYIVKLDIETELDESEVVVCIERIIDRYRYEEDQKPRLKKKKKRKLPSEKKKEE